LNSAPAIVVWSFAAAGLVWYLMLGMTARNQDSPWFANAIAFLVWLGGILLALSVAV
jgi:hypothetical protein